ncbi:hypothetical protein M011DRAFT_469875 [Sporormia fimetaria CBS 119925]|uniref:Mitochondrial carrier protein pet8 n=1 Tax=Sporormia fimetaria CBS 119925 TaxID=1340428 RepID=A0A6A6V7M0_9PLEO|nr:hypothetical protein M011DRAFT_469875 [Sporormia fimetaria CBS 119925]
MSAFRSLAARRTPLFTSQITQRAALHQSSALYAGKESRLNTNITGDDVEAEKQDLLKKQKEGKGHWKEELASNSESIVKADRGEMDASEEAIKKLQEETKRVENKGGK